MTINLFVSMKRLRGHHFKSLGANYFKFILTKAIKFLNSSKNGWVKNSLHKKPAKFYRKRCKQSSI